MGPISEAVAPSAVHVAPVGSLSAGGAGRYLPRATAKAPSTAPVDSLSELGAVVPSAVHVAPVGPLRSQGAGTCTDGAGAEGPPSAGGAVVAIFVVRRRDVIE